MIRRAIALSVSLGIGAAFACGSSDENAKPGGDGGTGSDGSLDGAVADSGGNNPNSDGGNAPDGNSCSAPVDMFIMFDRSGSMNEPQDNTSSAGDCNIGQTVNSKWCKAINALSAYFKSQGATGHAASLQFFPVFDHDQASCANGDKYNVAALPAADFSALPTNSFDSLLNMTSPATAVGVGTPTEAAIRGLSRFTADHRRPGRVTAGILITDGDPNGCDEDVTHLSALLDAHYKATMIRTYVIGMQGASFSKLETIAAGGGDTPQHPDAVGAVTDTCGNGNGPCLHWNVGAGDPAAFTAALTAIQESTVGCKDGGGYVNPI